jgi:hypothetical protein
MVTTVFACFPICAPPVGLYNSTAKLSSFSASRSSIIGIAITLETSPCSNINSLSTAMKKTRIEFEVGIDH